MRTSSLVYLICLAGAAPAVAQTPDPIAIADSLNRVIQRATVLGDLAALADARTLAERALVAYPGHVLIEHYLAESLYREAAQLMDEDGRRAQVLLDRAQDLLDGTVQRTGVIAETRALRGSVIGMRITGVIRGISLGPKATAAIDQALQAGPENPRVWLAHGVGTLHKPGFLGGGPDQALAHFRKAEELFERELARNTHTPGHPTGGAAELRAWVGIAHQRAGRTDAALESFRSALELEPDYAWVRDVLIPGAPVRWSPTSRMTSGTIPGAPWSRGRS